MSCPSKEDFVFAAGMVAKMVAEGKTREEMEDYAFHYSEGGRGQDKRHALIHAVANYWGYQRGIKEPQCPSCGRTVAVICPVCDNDE